MAEDNLVLEHLREIRTVVDRIERDHGDRLDRIEHRLSALERGQSHAMLNQNDSIDETNALRRRIERIERRLELRGD